MIGTPNRRPIKRNSIIFISTHTNPIIAKMVYMVRNRDGFFLRCALIRSTGGFRLSRIAIKNIPITMKIPISIYLLLVTSVIRLSNLLIIIELLFSIFVATILSRHSFAYVCNPSSSISPPA